MKKVTTLMASVVLSLTLSGICAAETGYISDMLYVPLRSGAGTQYRVIHTALPSGTQLQIQRVQGEWALVTTQDGVEGWLQSQYLTGQPTARLQLAQAEQRLASTQQENATLSERVAALEQQNAQLQEQLQQQQQAAAQARGELSDLRALSADAIDLNQRHRELLEQHQILQTELDTLRAENDRLSSDNTVNKWLYGAGLVILGIFLSIILPALKPKKRFSDWA